MVMVSDVGVPSSVFLLGSPVVFVRPMSYKKGKPRNAVQCAYSGVKTIGGDKYSRENQPF